MIINYSRAGFIAALQVRWPQVRQGATPVIRASSIWTIVPEMAWETLGLGANYLAEQRIWDGVDADMRSAIIAAIEGIEETISEAQAAAVADAVASKLGPAPVN